MDPLISQQFSIVTDKFDYFIVDLWGVIHDGTHPYPGVIETLTELKNRKKQVIFLSNAPRRAKKAVEVLEHLGIEKGLYHHVLTSGEVTHHYLAANQKKLGKRYIYIGPKKDIGLADGLDFTMVENAADADFAVVTGFDSENSTLDEKESQVADCLKHKLPLICANPDFEVVKQSGVRMKCAGLIAKDYEKRGGKVTYFGKPYPAVYKECLEMFGSPDLSRVAAVGDSLETDIAGAKAMGIHAILCTGGILAETLKIAPGELPKKDVLDALLAKAPARPEIVIPAFRW